MWAAAIELERPPVCIKPVRLLFVFMGDGEYFLAKAENADEYVGCPDLAGAAIEPLDLVTGIIDITIFAGLESS